VGHAGPKPAAGPSVPQGRGRGRGRTVLPGRARTALPRGAVGLYPWEQSRAAIGAHRLVDEFVKAPWRPASLPANVYYQ
jgi:hypothetical protein